LLLLHNRETLASRCSSTSATTWRPPCVWALAHGNRIFGPAMLGPVRSPMKRGKRRRRLGRIAF